VLGVRGFGWVVLGLALSGVGCSSHLKRGGALYAEGRYVEAAEVFEHTESQLGEATARERAEYGTYRGLTLLVLGDLRNAHRWLAYAYQLEQLYPGSLRSRERAHLDRGWYDLGARIRSQTPGQVAPPNAIAVRQPPGPPPAPTAPRDTVKRSLVNP
jgi:tetratricopeptide (TPR) repeat protein